MIILCKQMISSQKSDPFKPKEEISKIRVYSYLGNIKSAKPSPTRRIKEFKLHTSSKTRIRSKKKQNKNK